MSGVSLNRQQATELLLSLTPAEAKRVTRRTAEIAEDRNDLGACIRGALEEIAAERAERKTA